ncbi:MAG: NAD(P)/FAD-dependent oxidoreductase [Acidobacteria bacterium]|nr:MAG: NAD(P)/FAD-dependent oxidoreductase [Acidobacteriota bacterium]
MAMGKKDVLIIGGGPAGIAASIWCADLKLTHLVIEKEASTGGQLHKIYNPITNYPGIRTTNARELAENIAEQAAALGGEMRMNSRAASIDAGSMCVELASGERLQARAIVVATGVRRRRLGLPGEAELGGVLESGAKQAAETDGSSVVIVGGGDAAFENALILAKHASEVTVIHHSDRFRAREQFLEPARQDPKIKILESTVIRELVGQNGVLKEIVVEGKGGIQRIAADHLLVRIGVEPNSELIEGIVNLDARGYAVTDANCETSAAMIFAIGDVASPLSPTIATAVGQAATAIKVIKARIANS